MVEALRAAAVTGGSGSNAGDDGGGHGARDCDCVHDARRAGTARTPRSGDGSSGDGSSVDGSSVVRRLGRQRLGRRRLGRRSAATRAAAALAI